MQKATENYKPMTKAATLSKSVSFSDDADDADA